MNIFFIGMGYMGSERLRAAINLKKKYKIKIVGFYDNKIKSIKIKNKNFKSIQRFLSKRKHIAFI